MAAAPRQEIEQREQLMGRASAMAEAAGGRGRTGQGPVLVLAGGAGLCLGLGATGSSSLGHAEATNAGSSSIPGGHSGIQAGEGTVPLHVAKSQLPASRQPLCTTGWGQALPEELGFTRGVEREMSRGGDRAVPSPSGAAVLPARGKTNGAPLAWAAAQDWHRHCPGLGQGPGRELVLPWLAPIAAPAWDPSPESFAGSPQARCKLSRKQNPGLELPPPEPSSSQQLCAGEPPSSRDQRQDVERDENQ